MKTRGDPRPPIVTPSVAVDAVVLARGHLLLVQRGHPPFVGRWAFPGGFVEVGETTEEAVLRELREETGVRARVRSLIGVYSDPRRDPRGHNIAVVYRLSLDGPLPPPRGGDDARLARWWPVASLPPLAFDHPTILQDALRASEGAKARRPASGRRGKSLRRGRSGAAEERSPR